MAKMNWAKVQADNRIIKFGSEPVGDIPATPIKPPKKKKTKPSKRVQAGAEIASKNDIKNTQKAVASATKQGKPVAQNTTAKPTKNKPANPSKTAVAPKAKKQKPPRERLSKEALQEMRLVDAAATAKKVVVERNSLPPKAKPKPMQAGLKPKKAKTSSKNADQKTKHKPLSVPPLRLKNPDAESIARATRPKKRQIVVGSASNVRTQPTQTPTPKKKIDYAKFVEDQLPRIPQMTLDELRKIWANCIRVSANAGNDNCDPAVKRLMEAIESRWSSRVDFEKFNEEFKWPDTYAIAGRNKGLEFDQPDGMFSYLEYRVGKTNGQATTVRKAILMRMFEAKLPCVFDKDYMDAWGEPKTARRLKKMAESLASFTRNLKRRENEKFDEAIRDWEADLKFLHEQYYAPLFSFGWPLTSL